MIPGAVRCEIIHLKLQVACWYLRTRLDFMNPVERMKSMRKTAGKRQIYSHSIIKNSVFYSTGPGLDLGFLLFPGPRKGPKTAVPPQYRGWYRCSTTLRLQ